MTYSFWFALTQITCDLGALAVGQQATIVVTVPTTPQSFTNTGVASLQSGQTDKAPANNVASLTISSH
jgi:Tfp pilus assembly protein PilF